MASNPFLSDKSLKSGNPFLSSTIEPTENLLQRSIKRAREIGQDIGAGAESFLDVASLGLAERAREADAALMRGLTGQEVAPRRQIEPATGFGRAAQQVGALSGFIAGGPGKITGLVGREAIRRTPSIIAQKFGERSLKGLASRSIPRAITGATAGALSGSDRSVAENMQTGAALGVIGGPIIDKIFRTGGHQLDSFKNKFRFRTAREVQEALPKISKIEGQAFADDIDDLVAASGVRLTKPEAMTLIDDQLISEGLVDDAGRVLSKGVGKFQKALLNFRESILRQPGDSISPKILVEGKREIFKSLPSGVKSGTTRPDGSQAPIFDVVGRVGNLLKERVPGIVERNARYAEFAGVRNQAFKLFKPFPRSEAQFQTGRAEEALAKVGKPFKGLDEGKTNLLRKIENITGQKFVTESAVRNFFSQAASTIAVIGGIGVTIELLDRLFPEQSKQITTVLDVSR